MSNRRAIEDLLPDYELGGRVGEGSSGVVWAARHRHLGRRVALKQLRSTPSDDGDQLRREARILSTLDHEHIVVIYDYREHEALRVIIMEYLGGGTFEQRRPSLRLDEVLDAIRAAAAGIGHAHRHGVLHRDIKPSNMMLDGGGRVKVADFGIASAPGLGGLEVTMDGAFIGTPAYIAPEQARASLGDEHATVTPASDQYSLAAVLYETLTGTPTHDPSGGALALCERRINLAARAIGSVRADLPATVCAAIMRALERDPGERHESVEAFAAALSPAPLRQRAAASTTAALGATTEGRATALIGRETEIDDLRRLVAEQRLVTVTAIGGVGKTALVRELARAPLEAFVDGLCFVDLSAITDHAAVALEVARALGLRDPLPGSAMRDVIDHLADRSLLLAFDNCEQVTESIRALVHAVTRQCRTVTIVATSRIPLDADGEYVYRLAPLPPPPEAGRIAGVVASPAVRLFVERARRQRRDFTIDAANAEAVREIVRRLDGIPLAIELAAARMRSLSVLEIAAHLHSRFDLLASASGDPRQRTLRDTIAWSFSTLSASEQLALQVCGVFAGGFDLEGAQSVLAAVTGADVFETIDVIDRLVDRSLVQRHEDPTGRSRYMMLESIKEFSLEQCVTDAAPILAGARAAQLEHFAVVAERDGPAMSGAAQVMVNARLRADQDNFLSALDTAAELPGGADTGLRIAVSLRYFLSRNGIAGFVHERIERLCATSTDDVLCALGFTLLVRSYCTQGRTDAAVDAAGRALAHAARVSDQAEVTARAVQSRALARLYAGDYAGGLEDARALVARTQVAADRALRGDARNLLAIALRCTDDISGARAEYQYVLEECQNASDTFGVAGALVNLSDCAIALGDLKAASRYLEDSAPLVHEHDSPELEAYFHGNLGLVAQQDGDFAGALREFALAIETSERIGDRQSLLNNLIAFAAIVMDSDVQCSAFLVAAADALAGRYGLTPDPNELQLHQSSADRLASRTGPDIEQSQRAGQAATPHAIVEAVHTACLSLTQVVRKADPPMTKHRP
jgi:non-specific serine/threonine protein kinase